LAIEKSVGADEQRAGSLAYESSKSPFDLVLGARLQNKNLPADDACRPLRFCFLGLPRGPRSFSRLSLKIRFNERPRRRRTV
jgi:hypothetical protein